MVWLRLGLSFWRVWGRFGIPFINSCCCRDTWSMRCHRYLQKERGRFGYVLYIYTQLKIIKIIIYIYIYHVWCLHWKQLYTCEFTYMCCNIYTYIYIRMYTYSTHLYEYSFSVYRPLVTPSLGQKTCGATTNHRMSEINTCANCESIPLWYRWDFLPMKHRGWILQPWKNRSCKDSYLCWQLLKP